MELKRAILVLADISGYTRFLRLHTMSLLHAERIITDLMEAIIDQTAEPLKVNKLEGDAILFYAEAGGDEGATARAVFQQAQSFFEAFNERSKKLTGCNNLCPCEACRQAEQLRLKTVIHVGEVAIKRVRHFEEIAGETVIVAHRLLKNALSGNEYILMTQTFALLLGDAEKGATQEMIEECEELGSIPVEVLYPGSREGRGSLGEPPAGRRRLWPTVVNAALLDGYAFARVLGFRKASRGAADRMRPNQGLRSLMSDCVRSLALVIRRE